ncbi:MAG: ABC transporter substrate-binding protein [Marmoricola sp.]
MTSSRTLRRLAAVLFVLPLLAVAGCGGGFSSGGGGTVTIVGQKFTEADIMTQLYEQMLDHAGFKTDVKNLGTRDVYLKPLEKGDVQISADYLSSMTDELTREASGENATSVASPDVHTTLNQLTKLGHKFGLTPLKPAKASDQNAFAVTKKFAKQHHLKTLSDLGKLGKPVVVAANSDCKARSDCAKGLEDVYGIKVKSVDPRGFDSPQSKQAVVNGQDQVAEVSTTDATVGGLGLVVLKDDKHWQHAENLVPIVNSKWLKKNPKARSVLNKLSSVLTTSDLKAMNAQVDSQRMQAATVAKQYLKKKGLLG